jgi:predicted SprT family Zn-dependent metalloprotease
MNFSLLCGMIYDAMNLFLFIKVCDTADRLRDTLIHELCHAATWVVDDVKDGHGPHWKAW